MYSSKPRLRPERWRDGERRRVGKGPLLLLPRCHGSRLCWHVPWLAVPVPLAWGYLGESGYTSQCVRVCVIERGEVGSVRGLLPPSIFPEIRSSHGWNSVVNAPFVCLRVCVCVTAAQGSISVLSVRGHSPPCPDGVLTTGQMAIPLLPPSPARTTLQTTTMPPPSPPPLYPLLWWGRNKLEHLDASLSKCPSRYRAHCPPPHPYPPAVRTGLGPKARPRLSSGQAPIRRPH